MSICEYNNIIYEKIIGSQEQEMDKNLLATKKIINTIIPGNISKSNYYQKVYKPFLHKTTDQMLNMSSTVDLKYNDEKFIFSPAIAPPLSTSYFINILCFGKSLTYLLKYVAFLFKDTMGVRNSNVCVFLVCDEESYNNYATENVSIIDDNFIFPKSFNDVFGKSDCNGNDIGSNQTYNVSIKELEVLNEINIKCVYSSHFLMKGVGGKRAFIQHYNKTWLSDNSPDFMCMTLDDNITAIYNITAQCNVRKTNKSKISNCYTVPLLNVYDELQQYMLQNPDAYFGGINKGKGTTDSNMGYIPTNGDDALACKIITNTVAIYKLNLARTVKLFDHGYIYNPYFTRFFEDIAFNSEVGTHTFKQNCYHLNFAHFRAGGDSISCDFQKTDENICDGLVNDHDENFPKYLKSKFKSVSSIEPVYVMYALYFKALYDANYIFISWSKSSIKGIPLPTFLIFGKDSSKFIGMPKASKYSVYTYIFYMYGIVITMNASDTSLLDICGPTAMRDVFLKWANTGIIEYSIIKGNNSTKVQYKMAQLIPFQLLAYGNTFLIQMYNGDNNNYDSALFKQLSKNYCNTMRLKMDTPLDYRTLLDSQKNDVLRTKRKSTNIDLSSPAVEIKKQKNTKSPPPLNPCDYPDSVSYTMVDHDFPEITYTCRNRTTKGGKRYYSCENTVFALHPDNQQYLDGMRGNPSAKSIRTKNGVITITWKEHKLICNTGGTKKTRKKHRNRKSKKTRR